ERLKKSVKKQRYGLVWMDVPEAFEDDVENKLPILKEVPELAIKNNDGKTTNILIEGDNYHALTCLNYTHKGKIDVIYIDPPYNTGSDGFRYKDKRILDKYPDGTEVPKDHPFRHGYWLSFMQKRLELAKDVLKDSGVIFISIDYNEFAQLKLLCDEIFGNENFVSVISRLMKSGGNKGEYFSPNIEYILVYAKNLNNLKEFRIPLEDEYIEKIYSKIEKTGDRKGEKYREMGLYQAGLDIRPNQRYWIKCPDGSFVIPPGKSMPKPIKQGERIKPLTSDGVYRWIYSRYLEEYKKGNIVFKKTKTSSLINQEGKKSQWNIYTKIWLSDRVESGRVPVNYIGDFENRKSSQELKNLDIDFQFAKPTGLIKHLIKITNNDNKIIVLDFFAGSGTTGHAVVDLNLSDNGTRQFILVSNNDEVVNGKTHKIVTDICYPRIKRVLNGFKKQKALGGSMKYYKTAFIGKNSILNATDQDKIELAHNAGELLAIAENTLELTKQNKFYQLFEDGNKEKYTAVYFREELDKFDEFIEIVKKLKKQTAVYIFSWGNEEDIEEFDDIEQIKIKTIPLPILEIYKQIYNLSTE
ncbi:MAG: site-specific DNA-methyltransferase, partial [Nanoarchaeota archaeon]|nr:site-specific DNA-methyltransferase [Nanoarchaeota archaeon]